MNIDTNLILIKGEDKTTAVTSWRFDPHKSVVFITFNGQKEFPFRASSVQFLKNPKVITLDEKIALKNDSPLFGAKQLQIFGRYCRVVYKSGYRELVTATSIRIVESALHSPESKDCFEYLRQLAIKTGLVVHGQNVLAKNYERIGFVRKDSVLSAFLNGKYEAEYIEKNAPIVYPFGFNLSQKKAVDNAMCHPISIIEGPPGTGKTQTILNIIANAVMRGESVAVVSSNNSATANVLEKLKKYDVDFIAAPLGSSSNKEAFIESQAPSLPYMREWLEVAPSISEMRRSEVELDDKLKIQNLLSKTSAELDAIKKEYVHFSNYYNSLNISLRKSIFSKYTTPSEILNYMAEYEHLKEAVSKLGWWRMFLWRLRYGIKKSRFIKSSPTEHLAICQDEYYRRSIAILEDRAATLKAKLSAFHFDAKMKRYSELSMMAFKASLAKKFAGISTRTFYNADDLWKRSESFIKDYPVVLSTTYSLRASLSNQFVYDYVIVDEASQVDLATGALALSCAKKAVIVGDLKQLPNVVKREQKQLTDYIFAQYDLPEAYRYSTHSLLSSVVSLFPDAPHVLLKEHYRCHPEIIGFCNQRFYNNELVILTEPKSDRQPLMVYRTVPGNHARDHVNQRQIDVITEEVFPQQHLNVHDGSVGIVTPYRNQADALQKTFAGTTVMADTADKFQGRERNVMIFATVDNEIGEFASDPNRLNVAVSRAIDQFIVVTDGNDNDKTSPIQELIGYIRYHNHEVVNSELHSVFDYLYRNYTDARAETMRKYGKVSEFDSENLMYAIIRDVLNESDYSRYGVVLHFPLRMIVSDLTKLDARELSFATNHLTHVDFLIFSHLTHQPILVVEVDGFSYHNTEKQQERDRIKDTILQKYNIPILRLSTVGNNERQQLIAALRKANGES